jgi:hypothetical protein
MFRSGRIGVESGRNFVGWRSELDISLQNLPKSFLSGLQWLCARLTGQKILRIQNKPNKELYKMRKFVLMIVTLASLLALSGTASAWIPPDCAATNCF